MVNVLEKILLGLAGAALVTALPFTKLNQNSMRDKNSEISSSATPQEFIQTWHDLKVADKKREYEKAFALQRKLKRLDEELDEFDLEDSSILRKQFEIFGYANFDCSGAKFGKIIKKGEVSNKDWGKERKASYVIYESLLKDLEKNDASNVAACVADGIIYLDINATSRSAEYLYDFGKDLNNKRREIFDISNEFTRKAYEQILGKGRNTGDKAEFVENFIKGYFESVIKHHEPAHLDSASSLQESEEKALLTELSYAPSYYTLAALAKDQKTDAYRGAKTNIFSWFFDENYPMDKLTKTNLNTISKVARRIYLKKF